MRISNQLAAFAALVLLITAWVEDNQDSAAPGAADRPAAISLEAAGHDSEEARDVRPDRPARARFSLMLFRFN